MEELAKENPYLEEACEDLLEMSQDEEKNVGSTKQGNVRSGTTSISSMRQSVQQNAHSGRDMKREMRQGIQEGRQQGIQQGIQQGTRQTLIDLYRKQILTIEQASEECGMNSGGIPKTSFVREKKALFCRKNGTKS